MSTHEDEAVRLAPSSTICASSMMSYQSAGGGKVNPPSAVVRAAELGAAWAERVVDRACKTRRIEEWPFLAALRRGQARGARTRRLLSG